MTKQTTEPGDFNLSPYESVCLFGVSTDMNSGRGDANNRPIKW